MMSILVKVILVLHMAFFPFILQIPPMLTVLLSVEELELLVIPYCHVFENHLHFLSLWLIFPSTSSYYHQAMVPILRHIVIINFHPVLVVVSSSAFFSYLQNRTCTETPFQVDIYEIIFPTSHRTHETGSEQESCTYFTLAMQSVQGWFQTAQRSIFLPYLLVRVFKIDDSWCVGNKVWRSFWILNFILLYISEHVLKS
jgi:hypothetical protein